MFLYVLMVLLLVHILCFICFLCGNPHSWRRRSYVDGRSSGDSQICCLGLVRFSLKFFSNALIGIQNPMIQCFIVCFIDVRDNCKNVSND